MNAYPYLPGIAEPFSADRLVLHILGPIVAVAIVIYLPIHLKGFNDLDHDRPGTGGYCPHIQGKRRRPVQRRRSGVHR